MAVPTLRIDWCSWYYKGFNGRFNSHLRKTYWRGTSNIGQAKADYLETNCAWEMAIKTLI